MNGYSEEKAAGWSGPMVGVLDGVTRLGFYLSGLALFLVLLSYVLEVVMRYIFSAPTSWTYDVIQWLMAVVIMLAMPEVTRAKGHIVISFFIDKLSTESRHRVGRWIALVGCILCWAAAWICFQETARQYIQNIETMWNHPIPKWWISGLFPYGFALSGLQMVRTGFSTSR